MKLLKTKNKTKPAKPTLLSDDQRLTFLEHVRELKRRVTIVAASVALFGTAAYFVQHQIVGLLLAPAQGQEMMYTTPGGGLDFLFRVCIYTGIVFSFPVIIYQFLKYLEPLLGAGNVRFALKGSFVSAILATAGILFGYYAGMPAALHFLFHQFTTNQIEALITIQSYMQFVTVYMLGAALLFQIPLILIFINRIKPLKPSTLFKHERWVILGAFVLAIIMNPTPNVVDQILLAGPMIVMYQVGIGMIAYINRGNRGRKRSKKIQRLLDQDATLQAERESRLASLQMMWTQAAAVAEHPADVQTIVQTTTPQKPTVQQPVATSRPSTRVVDGLVRRAQRPVIDTEQRVPSRPAVRQLTVQLAD